MEYIEEADYDSLIIPYQDAMANLMTRLDSLNNDYRRKYKNYPIHHMQERIKKKESIEERLRRKGYRSLHIIVGIPVYHIDGMDYYPVEIQMRTMAMDLWASMEHRICYKNEEKIGKDSPKKETFKEFAKELYQMEQKLSEMK